MKYPLRNEYDTAIRNLDKFVFDSVLKVGTPIKQTKNPHLIRSYNGGKAVVYEIQTDAKKYALKCWVEDLGDLKIRYREIDTYLQKIDTPYFVDFAYKENGILVNGQKYPIVRMEWIDGTSFKKFITNNINNPQQLRNLADKFLKMMQVLHQHHISHGDLQHGNIMIQKDGEVCLIDYDGLHVPSLSNEKDTIKGLPGYQHPNRNKLIALSPKADYFSELVIYLSLLVLSIKPSYWKDVVQEERLFFSETDFLKPNASPIFDQLKRLSPEVNYYTTELERFCNEPDIHSLRPLEDLVSNCTAENMEILSVPSPNLSPSEVETVDNLSTSRQFVTKVDSIFISTPAPQSSTNNLNNANSANTSPQNTRHKPVNINGSNIWDKLDAGNLNSSAKPNEKKAPKEVWDKFGSSTERHQPVEVKNESIWNKFTKSISSIWRKFKDWFTP